MAGLGQGLRFGTFVTPGNAPPERPVELAQFSERLGYDLVTFQDHPYQPRFLDTWTLLSWVAARTERIHLAGNVHNLRLRPPAVLARAAASLDLLSGGRFELGLGAGAFGEAVVGMGGPDLTPGESVTALEEGIDIIRELWNPDGTGVRYEGEHHRLAGAKRGPAPAHDIQIWLGALKPRMLRLIGRKGDGWLPSLGPLKLADLPAANRIIDEAATDAGRDPRTITRLLNVGGRFEDRDGGFLIGPPAQWVDQLLPLHRDGGVSVFILMADDPATMQRFAEEVVPALRAA